jgi:hypothetical protein
MARYGIISTSPRNTTKPNNEEDCNQLEIETQGDPEIEPSFDFGLPMILVLRKYQDWCVLQLSRGMFQITGAELEEG